MSIAAILASAPSRLLHPAFDVQEDLLTYGFGTPRGNVHVLSDGGKIVASAELRVQLQDRVMQYQPPQGMLARLDDQWNREDLRRFIESPTALTGRELYERLNAAWRKHVDLDHEGKYVILVCWHVMTYLYPVFSSVPFLHLLGPKGTGKSQTLDLLAALSRDGYKSRATSAVVGDLIQSRRVTLLFDQANSMSPEHVDLFADSYRARARRTIVDMNKRGEPQEFETFGPKAFAGIEALDADLADRTILITTTPTALTLEPVVLDDPQLAELRAQTYRWALVNYWKLRAVAEMLGRDSRVVASVYPELYAYHGRQRDLWLPIEAVMEMLEVPPEDREAARHYYQRSQTATMAELPGDHVELLHVLLDIVGQRANVTSTSRQILDGLEQRGAKWSAQKFGLALKTLNVCVERRRSTGRDQREYLIDGDAVRSLADRYGLQDRGSAEGGDGV